MRRVLHEDHAESGAAFVMGWLQQVAVFDARPTPDLMLRFDDGLVEAEDPRT